MAYPTPYVRSYDFEDYQVANPTLPLPGNELDEELDLIRVTLDEIDANLQLIQKSDGTLANGIVGADQLTGALKAVMGVDATLEANINLLGPVAANITTLAGVVADITTVAGAVNDTSLAAAASTVASIEAAVTAVSAISAEITDLTAILTNTAAAWKAPCRVRTTANITLANLQTVDGVSLAAGDRVFVCSQSTPAEDGIYLVVDGGAWTRTLDCDAAGDLVDGSVIPINEGTTHANTRWRCDITGTWTPGSSTLTNVQVGVDGATGASGADGSSILIGSGAPAGGLGNVGDTYIDYGSSTIDLYEKTGASTWTDRADLKGSPGGTGGTSLSTQTTGAASGDDADLGPITFGGRNDTPGDFNFADFYPVSIEDANGAEYGAGRFRAALNNTMTEIFRFGAMSNATKATKQGLGLGAGFNFFYNRGSVFYRSRELILLDEQTASASATLDFETLPTGLKRLYFEWDDLMVATDDVELWIRMKFGGAYKSGASDYQYGHRMTGPNVGSTELDSANSEIKMTDRTGSKAIGNAASEFSCGDMMIPNPLGTAHEKIVEFSHKYTDSQTFSVIAQGIGRYIGSGSTGALEGVRIMAESGNLASGTVRCWGLF